MGIIILYKFDGGKIFIEKAINEGADSLGAVQQATKAGSGCGRCSANVEKVTLELLKENK